MGLSSRMLVMGCQIVENRRVHARTAGLRWNSSYGRSTRDHDRMLNDFILRWVEYDEREWKKKEIERDWKKIADSAKENDLIKNGKIRLGCYLKWSRLLEGVFIIIFRWRFFYWLVDAFQFLIQQIIGIYHYFEVMLSLFRATVVVLQSLLLDGLPEHLLQADSY